MKVYYPYLLRFSAIMFFLAITSFVIVIDAQKRLQTVVIDAGHGGKDPGALGSSCREKDIVLSVATKLGALINDSLPSVKTVFTRDQDVFIPLDKRAKIANDCNADLFISIHANWIKNPNISGAETFVLGLHRSKENLEVAQKENSVIVLEDNYTSKYEGFDPTSPESYIIFELMQNSYLDQSINMASKVQNLFESNSGRNNRGVKQAGFLVLRQTAMPSILVELGFLSNRTEEKYLKSSDGQTELANQLFNAFKEYKLQYDDMNNVSVKKTEVEVEVEKGIVFKVQLTTTATPLSDDNRLFTKYAPLTCYNEGGMYKYMSGSYSKYDEANVYLKEMKKTFPDCFMVAFENGKKISVREARKKADNR